MGEKIMSEYNDIFLEIENLIAESEKSDDVGIDAGKKYLSDALGNIESLKKDGLHKKPSAKKKPKSAKDKLTGNKSKFKEEEDEEEKKTDQDSSEELDKEFSKEEDEESEVEGGGGGGLAWGGGGGGE